MNFNESLLKSVNFNVIECSTEYLGHKTLIKDVKIIYDWNSSPSNPFLDLNVNRIYYVREGEANVLTKSGMVNIKEGYVYLFPSNSIIATKCDISMLQTYLHFTFNSPLNYFDCFKMSFSYKINSVIISYFDEFLKKFASSNLKDIIELQALFSFILAPFFDNAYIINCNFIKFTEVLNYIEENLDKDISIPFLANIMNFNVVYFSNLFKQTFNVSPLRFIQNKKVFLAQILLINTNLTVKEISEKCGFKDQYNFSKFFFKKMKLYPTHYLKKFKESH